MENNQRTSITVEVPSEKEIASKREIAPISFGVAIILFLLPFCDLHCSGGGQKIASVSGLNLVTGKRIVPEGADNSGPWGNPGYGQTQRDRMPPNFWAILAFAGAITGLGFYLKKHPFEALVGTMAGGAGVMALIIMRILLKSNLSSMQVMVSFKFAYWLTILALIVAGGISFLRWKLEGFPTPEFNKPGSAPNPPSE